MANNVSIRVGAPGAKQASSEIQSLRDKFSQLQQTSAKGLAIGAGAAITTAGLNLVKNAVGDLGGEIQDSVDAYREQQVASTKLDQSLKENAQNWDGNTSAIKSQIDARVKLGFTDTDLTNSLGQLVGATHDVTKALDAQSVAMDLARYKQISLADASQLVTNVMAGNYRGLKQLGIATTGIHDATSALAAIEAVAGGQAQQYATTDLGKMDAAYAEVDEAQEKFGKGLSKIEAVLLPAAADAVGTLGDALDSLQTSLDNTASTQDKLAAGTTFFDDLASILPILQPTADKLDAINAAAQGAAGGMQPLDHYAGKLADDSVTLGQNLLIAAGGAGRTADTIEYLRTQMLAASTATDELATEIETQLYGKAISAGQRAQLVQNIDDLRKALHDAHSKRDATILAGQLASAQEALFDFDLQAAEQAGPAALQKFLKDTLKNSEKTNPQLAALAANLLKVDAAASKTGNGITVTVRSAGSGIYHAATGAKAKAGQPFIVGEEGEELFVPDAPGTIVPHDTTKAMMGGGAAFGASGAPVTVVLQLPMAFGMTPAQGQQVARAFGPLIAREFQRLGLLPRARAF